MAQTYEIYDPATGFVVDVQSWDDAQAPVVRPGLRSRPISAAVLASGTFTGTGAGAAVQIAGAFNISVWGNFVGAVRLERSFDGGTTFIPVAFPSGTLLSFTTPTSGSWGETELGVSYRMYCTALSSGLAQWRISR